MSELINKVFDFNEQVIGIAPTGLQINVLSEAQFEWTMKAFEEEIREFSDARSALVDSNVAFEDVVVGMVDACLDEIYFQLGTLKKMGLTRTQTYECFMAIHNANMTKKRGKTARGSEEDATKPVEFVDPKVAIRKIIFGD